MKAYVLLGPFCGFRRGKEHGLRRRSVRLKEGLIRVENNFVDLDGNKAPKRGSFGEIPIAPELDAQRSPPMPVYSPIARRCGGAQSSMRGIRKYGSEREVHACPAAISQYDRRRIYSTRRIS
jgi:hypothetical protein